MNSSGTSLYFPHLNLLRAFAALTVVLYHIIRLKPWPEFPAHTFPFQWFDYGWMAVDIFFVLSGFVIMLTAQAELAQGGQAQKRFVIRRLTRILPLYFLTLFADLFIRQPELLQNDMFWAHLMLHVGMIHNWSIAAHDSIDGPNWTLAFEMQFYLLVWVLMPLLARMRWQWLLAAVLVITFGWRAAVFAIAESEGFELSWKFIYAVQVPGMLDQLGFGMILGKWVFGNHPYYQKMMQSPQRNGWLLVGAAFFVFALGMAFMWPERRDYWDTWSIVVFFRSFLALSFALLVAGMVILPRSEKPNVALRTGYFLGEISYGIYLWHMIALWMLRRLEIVSGGVFTILLVAVSVTLAIITFYTVERPAMRWGRKICKTL